MKRLPVVRVQLVRDGSVPYEVDIIRSPKDAVGIARAFIGDTDREHAVVLCLDTKNKVIAINTVSIGSLNAAVVHPREVFKPAILANSAAIIFAHNHPSGDTTPSPEDITLSRRLSEAGETLGISMLDSIIVSDTGYTSLKERGDI